MTIGSSHDVRASKSTARARSMREFDALQVKVFTKDSYDRGQRFQPRSDDLLISPFAKSGTTWLQQIAHGLRSRGSMDFEEISFVIPWIEVAHDMELDLDAPQVADPRIYKAHFNWHDVPKGGRYICAFRKPQDVVVSYYRFMEDWFIEPGAIDLDSFAQAFCPQDGELGGYWLHLVSWWEQLANKDVLLLLYEDMKKNLPAVVRQIAGFMNITLDDELEEIVVRQSSRDFMLAHKHQFDERGIRKFVERRVGLPFRSDAHKVTAGPTNDTCYQLSRESENKFESVWQKQVKPRLRFEDYDELCRALRFSTSGGDS